MKSLDLNLLLPLLVLLEERNVTRSAERLNLSQPATSAALGRLRRHFHDELLTRAGRSYQLTPFAQTLLPVVQDTVRQVNATVEFGTRFDPATSERSFEIAASDYSAVMLIEPLRRILAAEAPHVAVDFVPLSASFEELSSLTKIDILVGPMGYSLAGKSRQLFRDSFVAVVDASNPILNEAVLTASRLSQLPHAVGFFGQTIITPADRLLEALGFARRPAAKVSGLQALPLLVEGTDLVALVPRMLALRAGSNAKLAILEFPVELEAVLVEAMYWHPTRMEDPATRWLRDVLKRAAQNLNTAPAAAPNNLRTVTIDTIDSM